MKLPKISEELKHQTNNLEMSVDDSFSECILSYGLNAVAEAYFFNRMSQLTKEDASEEDIIKQLGIVICPINGNFEVKGEFLFNLKRIEQDIYVPKIAYKQSMLKLPGIEVFRSIQPFDLDEGNGAEMDRWWNYKRREKLHKLVQGKDNLTDTHLHKDGLWYAKNLWQSSLKHYIEYANLAEDSKVKPVSKELVGFKLAKHYSDIVRELTRK